MPRATVGGAWDIRRVANAAALGLVAALSGCGKDLPPPPPPTPEPATPAPTPEPPTPAPDPDAALLQSSAGDPVFNDAHQRALAVLGRVVDWEDADPGNAWALAHGVLARGLDFYARDGRPARDVLAADFVRWRDDGGTNRPFFPKSLAGARVEPHTGLIVKNLLERGVGIDDPIAKRPGSPTTRSLVLGTMAAHTPGKGGFWADPDDAPWLMQAWCQSVSKGGPKRFTAADGREYDVGRAAAELLGHAERDTAFLVDAMANGTTVEKRKQGIFGYSCGGGHLIQAVVACAAADLPPMVADLDARAATIVGTYLFRLELETGLVERAMQQQPRMREVLLNQDVKFLGHLLETVAKAVSVGILAPTQEQHRALRHAEVLLLHRVLWLERLGAYAPDALSRLRAGGDKGPRALDPFQQALDRAGDAAHALYGLELWAPVRETVAPSAATPSATPEVLAGAPAVSNPPAPAPPQNPGGTPQGGGAR